MKDSDATDLNKLVEKGLSLVGIKQLLDWVAQYSWWAQRQVYEKVPVVYPRTRRKHSKEHRGDIDAAGNRLWFNEPAIEAFWRACGKKPKQVKNYYICHIYEDSVHDSRHFTNLANMTALPKSLQSLSEWEPVSAVLKYHSFKMYGYTGPDGIEPPQPGYYPSHWPNQTNLPPEQAGDAISRLERQRVSRPQFHKSEGYVHLTPESLHGDLQAMASVYTEAVIEAVPPENNESRKRSYVKGASCKMLGLEHEYKLVEGKNYERCDKCNSTRTAKKDAIATTPPKTHPAFSS